MKSFKSIADATRSAAEVGGTLDVGGRRINAGGTRLSVMPRTAPTPAPAVAPEPPAAAPDPMDRIAEVISLQARVTAAQADSMGRLLMEIVDRLPKPEAPAAPRRMPMFFDVVRDADGLPVQLMPTYGDPGPGSFTGLATDQTADGLVSRITPLYQ